MREIKNEKNLYLLKEVIIVSELDNIRELDNFYEFKQYIKQSILESEDLFRLIYFCFKNPFDELTCSYPENPYELFQESYNTSDKTHGVVLFSQKNNEILNYETPVILINFSTESSQDNKSINYTQIEFSIICKGTNIQQLENGKSRSYAIAELIDNFMNHSNIVGSDKVKRLYFDNNVLNEQNCGYKLAYQSVSTSYKDEIQIYEHVQNEDSYGITRESFSLVVKDNPILVGIQPCTVSKENLQHGYDINMIRTMYCDIIPEVVESTLIKYNNIFYKIEKIVEYEDYLECLLGITYTAKINE
jgi:hypothetical protein